MRLAGLDGWHRALLALCAAGLALFGGLLFVSYAAPLTIERLARDAIQLEVERRVGARIDALSDTRLAGLARKALEKTSAEAAAAEAALRQQVPRRVANLVADMLKADCECRKRLARRLQEAAEAHLDTLRDAEARLTDWIEHGYATTRAQLLQELRIFSAVNALCLLLLGSLCLWRRPTTPQLMLVAATVLSAAVVVGGFYLFKQDWLHTLVFGTYVGWGYAAYLAAVTGLFADIAFNEARISANLLNAIAVPTC
ncbi:hypothetical protein [Roseateles puraquae]|uniref:Uncharacterized protein n=1 Tax=Roseateles puraquae TaxID=431059 RepID=A0A254NEP5_9BURK|nr:hypothetical protein [Roseateles puraquae]MDG0852629.1 hypothetical protein [Roseateles puraquae]OWR05342.1 hypothetical protein CDO81_02440 [Roseateles puraquae]